MKPPLIIAAAAALAGALIGPRASAHHSLTVEFDISRMVTVSGVITEMKWTNPHAWLYIDVKDEKGIMRAPAGTATPSSST